MKYKDLNIIIALNKEESEKHIEEDLKVLTEKGIDNIVKESFIPWLLGTDFQDKDKDKVFEGLKLYEIEYHYGKIIEKYSPTGEENYFGQFEFCYESGNDYTSDILEAVAMQIFVLDGKIVKVSGFDI